MAETIYDLSGNVIVADEFRGLASTVNLPEIESTSETLSVGPGTLVKVIQEILDLIEAGDA